MKRWWWRSLYLLGPALALGMVILLYERHRPAPVVPSPGLEARPLIDRPGAVTSLHLQDPAGQFTFVRENEQSPWTMTEPIRSQVQPFFVDLMCSHFLQLSRDRIIGQGDQDLAQFGLSDPAGRITFHFQDLDQDLILEIGKLNPTREKLYARVSGRPEIFLIDRYVGQYLSRGLEDFRLRSLLMLQEPEAVSLEIRYLDPAVQQKLPRAYSVRLVAQTDSHGQKQWKMLEPFQEPVEAAAVGGFLNGLSQALDPRVVKGAAFDPARFGLDRPALEVSVEKTDQTLERVAFSRPTPDGKLFYAYHAGGDLIFEVRAANLGKVFNQDFRTSYVLPPGAQDTFNRVAVSFPREQKPGYALTKTKTGTWFLEGTKQPEIELEKVFWIMTPLIEFPAGSPYIYNRNPDLSAYGLDRPRAVIQLYEEGREIANVAIGSATDNPKGCFVLDRKRDALMRVPQDLYPRIPPDRAVFLREKAQEPNHPK
jgi:hypothetical protein